MDITSVGTAAAPIVFQAQGPVTLGNGVLSLDGAAYVTIEGPRSTGSNSYLTHQFSIDSITVSSSSHIALDGLRAIAPSATATAVHVTSGSSDVTVSRDTIIGAGTGVLVDSGGSGIDVSEDGFSSLATGVSVTGTPGTDIVSNTLVDLPHTGTAISVAGGSTGTSIENNIVANPSSAGTTDGTSISVDSSSTAGTALDYNVVYPTPIGGVVDQTPYSWAGASYTTAAALLAATGQGAHDLNADPQLNAATVASISPTAPEVNSANASAPGMLDTDYFGEACTGDGLAAVTGTGSPAFCARGAIQPVFTTTVTPAATSVDALGVTLHSSIMQTAGVGASTYTVANATAAAVRYAVDWGDGQTGSYGPTDVPSHTYASAGTYTITDTAALTTGATGSATTAFTASGSDYTPYGPVRVLDTRSGLGAAKAKLGTGMYFSLKVAGVGAIPSGVTAVAINLTATDTTVNGYLSADGTSVSNVNYRSGQTVANNAIVPVSSGGYINIYNVGPEGGSADVIGDVTGYFTNTAASQYAPVPLERILDTRKGTGAPKAQVAGGSGVPVAIAGIDSIPSNATAVAVHVTAVDGTGNGWVAAEPDGAGTPTTSILNYLKSQTVSNTVIVPVGPDGKIELFNGGTKTPVDLIADVSGYFSATAPDAYIPVTPYRAVDTRETAGPAGGETVQFPLGNDDIPGAPSAAIASGATMVTNITVTDTQGNGYLTVFPAGTTQPTVSNLNYLTGQTVANMGVLNTTRDTAEIYVYNGSAAHTDVIFDVFGYFAGS
ncbi:hypothetical protein KDL01_10035 [Actinospica durhamensis]|uniref:PKD domain-containing protein n=1 Tax=Actinospica durhamensis TaxID=1508375 RepID=A0A941EMB3_9ACTN|nr:hypothetical protein [Actinospica durhamensis]MBR7833605.1 hypothetical protein [Actinospica durhamensis]